MTKHKQFITVGRSTIAYLISMVAGAMALFPVVMAETAVSVSSHRIFDSIDEFMVLELGAVWLGLLILALPVLPLYIVGMIIAKKIGTAHWLYFTTMGIVLLLCVWASVTLLSSIPSERAAFTFNAFVQLVVPIGAVSGLACWLFLYFTWSREPA